MVIFNNRKKRAIELQQINETLKRLNEQVDNLNAGFVSLREKVENMEEDGNVKKSAETLIKEYFYGENE